MNLLGLNFSADRTGLSIAVGAGIRFPVNDRINVYVEGRYAHLFVEEFEDGYEDPIKFLPVTAGLVLSF